MQFRQSKVTTEYKIDTRISFRLGAVDQGKVAEFHYTILKEPSKEMESFYRFFRDGTPYYCGGIEIHSKTPLYDFDTKPVENCTVLAGDCYTDGTSLGASDLILEMGNQIIDEVVWDKLYFWLVSRVSIPDGEEIEVI